MDGETGLISSCGVSLVMDQASGLETKVNREEKQELIASLNAAIAGQTFVAVTHNNGMTVAEVQALRKQMREALEMLKIEFNTTNDTLLKYDSDLTNNNFIIN